MVQRWKCRGIYRGVTNVHLLPLSDAISASVGGRWFVAFPFRGSHATTAGSTASAHGTPLPPATVHRCRSRAHVHAFLVNAPLNTRSFFILRSFRCITFYFDDFREKFLEWNVRMLTQYALPVKHIFRARWMLKNGIFFQRYLLERF